MSENFQKPSSEEYWGETPILTAEQTIQWLEGHRRLMFEVWEQNPGSREEWEKINQPSYSRCFTD